MKFESDPLKLLVRWQGLGAPLSELEREMLIVNLFDENLKLGGNMSVQAHAYIDQYIQKVEAQRSCQNFRV